MKKPFDIGNTIVSASISQNGNVVTLNSGHKKHGFIKLTSVKSFDNKNWYEPEKVREYRNSFLSDETYKKAFGVKFEDLDNSNVSDFMHFDSVSNILMRKLRNNKIEIENNIFIPPDENSLILEYKVRNLTSYNVDCKFTLNGELGIIRAAYGQITENGPIQIPEISNCLEKAADCSYALREKGTESSSRISLVGDFEEVQLLAHDCISSEPVNVNGKGRLSLKNKEVKKFALILSLSDEVFTKFSVIDLIKVEKLKNDTMDFWKGLQILAYDKDIEYIINRNFAYSFGCCCMKKFGAMITDHQSLPLTWNRDNYFMFKLMEEVYRKTENPELLCMLKKHIKWMFTWVTEEGWGRSHLVTGKVKDKVFQFDQQCYPILEFYDVLRITELDKDLINLCLDKLDMVSSLLLDKAGIDVMLFETDENPADDPVLYPYHFSTQILAWKTFSILDELNKIYSFSNKDFANISRRIKDDVFKFMMTGDDNQKMFCYTTDAKGNFELYHDANDLPTVLAPVWGFIDVGDDVYQNTLKWAFSDKNRGYYSGKYGGLGSDHAKGHWPLGTAQLLAVAIAENNKNNSKDSKLFEKTLSKLKSIAMKDGLFSESVYPDNGEVFTRYCFAWPGATISWLFLLNIK